MDLYLVPFWKPVIIFDLDPKVGQNVYGILCPFKSSLLYFTEWQSYFMALSLSLHFFTYHPMHALNLTTKKRYYLLCFDYIATGAWGWLPWRE